MFGYSSIDDNEVYRDEVRERLDILVTSVSSGWAVTNLSNLPLSETIKSRRAKAIQWINQIMDESNYGSIDARDIAFQVFDKFITTSVRTGCNSLENSAFFFLVAATSAIIASKLHDSKAYLTCSNFPYFAPYDLSNCERFVLERISYVIAPNQTPVYFMRLMLCIWPSHRDKHESLIKQASQCISRFSSSVASLSYSPPTIAVSALLLAFRLQNLDSSDWLRCLPTSLRTTKENQWNSNIDHCLENFQNPRSTSSPTAASISSDSFCREKSLTFSISPTTVMDSAIDMCDDTSTLGAKCDNDACNTFAFFPIGLRSISSDDLLSGVQIAKPTVDFARAKSLDQLSFLEQKY